MKKLIVSLIGILIVLGIIAILIWPLPVSSDPQTSVCDGGEISTHPASPQALLMMEETLRQDNGTGITAAIVIDGQLVFAQAVGDADRNHLLKPNARMRTGSVAKLFTAVAAARLIEMSKLDLNTPAATLVPELPNEGITLQHLGTHTSGIRHYDFQNFSEANNRELYPSLTGALELFINDPLLFEPGSDFNYTSFGINLMGVMIERAYGTPYDEALNELIAQPLSLSSLAVDDIHAQVPCRSTFHTLAFGNIRINTPWRDNSDFYPSGGLVVDAADLAIFTDAVFNSNFLQPETVEMFTKPVFTPDGEPTGYGFIWQIGRDESGDMEWYGHGGSTNGAYASVRFYPETNMTVVGMSNYNYWLTSARPQFFSLIREELPALFRDT